MNDLYVTVLREVEAIRDAFKTAGYQLYLVGGIVRDMHLEAPLDDLDLDMTSEASPEAIKALVAPLATAVWTQGERFGTIGAQINDRPYEITTHRAESYNDASRKPEVVFGDDIEVDLSRRDFTLNAMAIRLSDGELIDPFDGLGALERRELVTPIEPEVSFADDPLRILRAARFIARYDLAVDAEVMVAGKRLIDRMSIVSAERIRDEFDKLLSAENPRRGLDFLVEVGAWPYIVSSIDSSSVPEIAGQLYAAPVDPGALDLTLRRTIVFSHCALNDLAETLSKLRYSKDEASQISLLLSAVDVITTGDDPLELPAIRRLVARISNDHIPMLDKLLAALDVPDRGLIAGVGDLDAAGELAQLSPVLTGEEVMELLDIAPGPEVGAAIKVLQVRRFEDGPLDRDGEVAYLLNHYSK